ncbi:hypothetical protein MPB2EB_0310 [Mycoavidus sp. B2-EB]|nr:hypothetical protein MPB2EB_0310 [Mycoavidus sp. B2-EB]
MLRKGIRKNLDVICRNHYLKYDNFLLFSFSMPTYRKRSKNSWGAEVSYKGQRVSGTLAEPDAHDILELYQPSLANRIGFKRLKSLLHLGPLKKTDREGAKAWLQGKLLVLRLCVHPLENALIRRSI